MTMTFQACAYEQYDPQTLIPANEATLIRLSELDWIQDDFEGKTILDIGCNAGLLSIYCSKLGASKVISVDVTQHFVDHFTNVVSDHKLNISVEKKALFDLDQSTHSSDIVLFMEVLHWIVQQGSSVGEAIAKVASLTKETLYFETPYDVNEPSIKTQAKYTETEYNLELIFKELCKYFYDVKVMKFMTYFGEMKNSKRIYIKATNKRKFIPVLKHISNLNFFEHKLPGNNFCKIFSTLSGIKILKGVSSTSNLVYADKGILKELLSSLKKTKGPLVLPDAVAGEYILHCENKAAYMIFPFVGNLFEICGYKKKENIADKRTQILDTIIACTKQLQSVDTDIVEKFKDKIPARSPIDVKNFSSTYKKLFIKCELTKFMNSVNKVFVEGYDRTLETNLVHDDLQTGNFVIDSNNMLHIVDIDNLRTGTCYSDLIAYCIYVGATLDELENVIEKFASQLNIIEPTLFDFQFCLIGIFTWMQHIDKRGIDCESRLIQAAIVGLQSVNTYIIRYYKDKS